ncbi:TERF1-interacting nuclear factor 2 isoform X3 [Monodelphis domestica]|uniref:TERF1-interacting nuclear factor 2 isoform X3 n=1 Tax=Monodelphis domestica TaxID=13616 RepID=UPI000443659D|nr:TERF1-interacting nuclear factor 2 isoform X3 [Monodelphis domestica]
MSVPSDASAAASSLRLVAAAAWWVVRRRLSAHYPRVLDLLGTLKVSAPGLVRPRHHARLCMGLRAKVVVEMILAGQPWSLVLDALNRHFPESGPPECSSSAAVWDRKIVEAHEAFCQRVKHLAEDPEDFGSHLQELEQEYGEPFLVALEKLLFEYLCQLEKTLPVLQLHELKEVLRGMQTETLLPLPLALTQYCMDMGWLLQESPLFTSVRGTESQEQSPLPSPQLEQVFQDPVPTTKPNTPFPQGQGLKKPSETLTGRDFNLAPLGRRQILANRASAVRGGRKDRPTVMLFPFRSMCLPVQDIIMHGNNKGRGQPMADPAGTMGTKAIPQGKHRNSARSLRGRAQEQGNWTSDEPSEQKENCLDYSLEPLRLPLPAVGAREPGRCTLLSVGGWEKEWLLLESSLNSLGMPKACMFTSVRNRFDSGFPPTVHSPSLCSPVVTIGDLVLDSDDEGNGQRGGKMMKLKPRKVK